MGDPDTQLLLIALRLARAFACVDGDISPEETARLHALAAEYLPAEAARAFCADTARDEVARVLAEVRGKFRGRDAFVLAAKIAELLRLGGLREIESAGLLTLCEALALAAADVQLLHRMLLEPWPDQWPASEAVWPILVGQSPAEVPLDGAGARLLALNIDGELYLCAEQERGLVRMLPGETAQLGTREIQYLDLLHWSRVKAGLAEPRVLFLTFDGDRQVVSADEPAAWDVRVEFDGLRIHVGERTVALCDEVICAGRRIELRRLLHWSQPRVHEVALDAASVRFPDGNSGLRDVSLAFACGQLAAILGPSGSGKSTLLNLLNGSRLPDAGRLLIDGQPVRDPAALRRLVSFVPQDDLLIAELSVADNLRYRAALLHPEWRADRIAARVRDVLAEVDLAAKAALRVGSPEKKVLSGGERKRLNVALELIGSAPVLILDEPTSGLSSEDSRRIMDVLKARAAAGSVVIAVVHQPGARLLQLFDRVTVLDRGGQVAFAGAVPEALDYFRAYAPAGTPLDCVEPELILETLEAPLRTLDGRSTEHRRDPPEVWAARFAAHPRSEVRLVPAAKSAAPRKQPASRARRLWLMLCRDAKSRVSNLDNVVTTLLVAPGLGALIGLILRTHESGAPAYSFAGNPSVLSYLFLAVIVCTFLGLTTTIGEVVRDRALLMRERMLDLPLSSYILAKFLSAALFGGVQVALFLCVTFRLLEIPELFAFHFAWLWLTFACAAAAGLLISTWPGLTARGAANLLPLALIPNIILAGSDVFPFDDMAHLRWRRADQTEGVAQAPEVSWPVLARWSYEGLLTGHVQQSRWQEHVRLKSADTRLRRDKDARGKPGYKSQLAENERRLAQIEKDLAPYRIDNLVRKVSDAGPHDATRAGQFPVSHRRLAGTARWLPAPCFNALVIALGTLTALLFAGLNIRYGESLWIAVRTCRRSQRGRETRQIG